MTRLHMSFYDSNRFMELSGKKHAFKLALWGDISPDVLDQIDFSVPRMDDPL